MCCRHPNSNRKPESCQEPASDDSDIFEEDIFRDDDEVVESDSIDEDIFGDDDLTDDIFGEDDLTDDIFGEDDLTDDIFGVGPSPDSPGQCGKRNNDGVTDGLSEVNICNPRTYC